MMTVKQNNNTKPQSRPRSTAAILDDWLNRWQREDHTTFRSSMRTVREYAEANHWEAVLDIEWSDNTDLDQQMRVDAQKLRRWFKAEHQISGPAWFDLMRLVAGAMPTTVRTGFINELFGHTGGVFVETIGLGLSSSLSHVVATGAMAKESGEAISASLNLPAEPTLEELLLAKKEIIEAKDSTRVLLGSIDALLARKSGKTV
ncbi:MAG: hypothetical protein WBH20_14850 [Oceanisphaera sp.]|uniref:hypothetical protein n=1 Tax=Oceanisphaera sp. TaxID=1929979 RepID=UPI003C74AB55